MTKSYPIEIIHENKKVLYFPKELDFPSIHTVAFGNLSTEVTALPQTKRKISISRELAEFLKIPDFKLRLHLFEKAGTLFIGPIVGIFTAGFTSYPASPLGGRSLTFSKLLSLYDRVGVLPVVFGIQHINWDQGSIFGYFYHASKWKPIEIPLPNVIYDRLPNRTVENLEMIQNLKSKFKEEYAIPWFNPGFFNKLDIYKKLSKNTELKQYLPKTIPFKDFQSLDTMLREFHHIYLKPIHGSLGKGIYQIKKVGNQYYVRFRDEDGKNRFLRFSSIIAINKFLQSQKISYNVYLIQQGIPLLKVEERAIDFRIHTNKNEEGKWVVSVIACKLAGETSVTTHILSGGTVRSMDEIFSDPVDCNEKLKKLTNAVIAMSEQLNKSWNEVLAEIGFDIGMDKDGNVWFFEANSKPGRSIFSHPKIRRYERFAQKLVLSYSIHLTEQVIKNPEKIFHDFVLQ